MIRKIIRIDEGKCNGCGLCIRACHEGALGMVDGKARLLREDYCDGMGDCLPACPAGAISFEEREAPAFTAVLENKNHNLSEECYGDEESKLCNFPIQIKLVPINGAFFRNAHLLIAADCTAFAYSHFHSDFVKNRITLIGCPKLDGVNYGEKLTRIFEENEIQSVTVVRMTVPCCGGLPFAVESAIKSCGKQIPLKVVTITPRGEIVE